MTSAALVESPSAGAKLGERPRIHALTSTRFFAALYVILYHYRWGIPPGSAFDRFLSVGYSSVCFFFLLSGYILATVYLRAEKTIVPRSFYVARFARIYPLYIVSVLADAPFAVLARVAEYGVRVATERVFVLVLSSAVMMQMWLPLVTTVNIPSWSLAIEAVFYLSFPFLGPWLWRLSRRSVLIIGVALWILSVAMHWILELRWKEPIPALELVSYIAIFALGILASRWQALGSSSHRKHTSGGAAWLVFFASCAGFALVVFESPWLAQNRIQLGMLLVPVFVGLIWVFSSSRILPVRLLSVKWLVLLGEASYALYLLQAPVHHVLDLFHLAGTPQDYPLYLGSCIGLSILSFYFFEKPARQWILRKLHTRTKETLEAASDAQ
jgi:peptidoglycan/LPS O-acetylase OafA/YrhL